MHGDHPTTSSQPLLAVHGCTLVLRSLPPPMCPGNEASMALYAIWNIFNNLIVLLKFRYTLWNHNALEHPPASARKKIFWCYEVNKRQLSLGIRLRAGGCLVGCHRSVVRQTTWQLKPGPLSSTSFLFPLIFLITSNVCPGHLCKSISVDGSSLVGGQTWWFISPS